MAIDDCMYDYLRPSDCWTDNPWAYRLCSSSDIATVCDENTEGAKPLYDAIDGEICLYTVGKRYTDEECERWEKELKSLVIKKTVAFEESDPNVADKTTTKRLTAGCVVVKDGEIIGGYEFGEQTARTNRIIRHSVFLPLGAEARKTELSYESISTDSHKEKKEYIYNTWCSLEKV